MVDDIAPWDSLTLNSTRLRTGYSYIGNNDNENGNSGPSGLHPGAADCDEGLVEKQPVRLFSCPFAKVDPDKHGNCLDGTYRKVSYLKQHVYRSHFLAFSCGGSPRPSRARKLT
jgi:hypothetical protein